RRLLGATTHVERLSACLDHRRASALYRDLAVCDVQLDVSDGHLCRDLRDHQHNRHGAAAGLHEQGHFNQGTLRRAALTAYSPVPATSAADTESGQYREAELGFRSPSPDLQTSQLEEALVHRWLGEPRFLAFSDSADPRTVQASSGSRAAGCIQGDNNAG